MAAKTGRPNTLYRNRRLDRRMVLITFQTNIINREIVDILNIWIQPQFRQRQRTTRQLLVNLHTVIIINMRTI